jgi:hypothetical protein
MVGNGVESAVRRGAPLPQLWDGVRPMYRARAAAEIPYIVPRLAIVAPGSIRGRWLHLPQTV